MSSFGHGTSRTTQVSGERSHRIDKEFAKYLLNCVESMMCLYQFMLTVGKYKWEQDTIFFSMSQMVMKRIRISYSSCSQENKEFNGFSSNGSVISA